MSASLLLHVVRVIEWTSETIGFCYNSDKSELQSGSLRLPVTWLFSNRIPFVRTNNLISDATEKALVVYQSPLFESGD